MTPWTVACQASLSMGIHLPIPGIKPKSPALQVDSFPSEPPGKPKKPVPSPGDLSDPGIKPGSRALQVDSLPAELPGKPVNCIERKKTKSLSRVQLFATPWTVAYHTPPSMGFSRQGYWNGLPLPSPNT